MKYQDTPNYSPSTADIFTGGSDSHRLIFYKVPFTPFQLQQLELFKNQLDIKLPHFFSDQELIRILVSTYWDKKAATQALKSSILWRQKKLSKGSQSLFQICQTLLQTGAVYIHGRDLKQRPLIIINLGRLNLVNYTVQDYQNLLIFVLQYAIQNLMTPGYVQNFLVITDINGVDLLQFPIKKLKHLIMNLQQNFRCRLIANYIVNVPQEFYSIWTTMLEFLEPPTINKIKLVQSSQVLQLKTLVPRSQYQKKYGGSAPQCQTFWPPCLPPVVSGQKQNLCQNFRHSNDSTFVRDTFNCFSSVVENPPSAFPLKNRNFSDIPKSGRKVSFQEENQRIPKNFKRKEIYQYEYQLEVPKIRPPLICINCRCEETSTCSILQIILY